MVAHGGVAGSSGIGKWSKTLEELHRRMGHRFARSEARERVLRYLVGLLGKVERKNGFYEKGILVKGRRGGPSMRRASLSRADVAAVTIFKEPRRLRPYACFYPHSRWAGFPRDPMHDEVRPARRRCNLAVGLLWQRDHPFLRSRQGPGVSGARRRFSSVGTGSPPSVGSNPPA